MKRTVNHPVYGEITCEENIWSGKMSVTIGKDFCHKSKKNTHLWTHDEITEEVSLKGNFVTGLFLTIRQEKITLVPKPDLLDYFLSVLPFALIIVWSYVPALYWTLPIAGGGFGGGVGTAALIIALVNMRKKSFGRKLLITLLCTVGAFVICFAFLVLFIAIFYIAKY